MIGIGVALVILALVFGALAAAGVPVVVALASILTAVGGAAVVGQVLDSVDLHPERHLHGRSRPGYRLHAPEGAAVPRGAAQGLEVVDAVAVAGNTANRAVLMSGLDRRHFARGPQ